MSERAHVNAQELLRIETADDGRSVCLHLVDDAGRVVVLRLPSGIVRAVGEIVPRAPEPACLHLVDSWRLRPSDDGAALVLTLQTPDGCAAWYVMKPWQVEGIATVASHSGPTPRAARLMN